jgi:hypothetical protein
VIHVGYIVFTAATWVTLGLGIAVTGLGEEARRLRLAGKLGFAAGVTMAWPLALLPLPIWWRR